MPELLEEYQYGERGVLRPGMIFRVSKGPYYVDQAGQRIAMSEKGKFKFWRFDPRGWILAHRVEKDTGVGGLSVLHVGKTRKSKTIEGMIVRGYVIRRPRSERGVDPELVAVDEGAKKGHCSKHPTYRGLRRPRVPCQECIALYREKNPDKPAAEKPVRRKERTITAPAAQIRDAGEGDFVAKVIADRKNRKLSCVAYGALIGVSGAAISMLETGKAKLTQRMRDKLSPLVNA